MDWASFLKHRSGSGYVAGSAVHAMKPARTCSITSKCSTTRNASTSGTECCRRSSSSACRKRNTRVSTKRGAIHIVPVPFPQSFWKQDLKGFPEQLARLPAEYGLGGWVAEAYDAFVINPDDAISDFKKYLAIDICRLVLQSAGQKHICNNFNLRRSALTLNLNGRA